MTQERAGCTQREIQKQFFRASVYSVLEQHRVFGLNLGDKFGLFYDSFLISRTTGQRLELTSNNGHIDVKKSSLDLMDVVVPPEVRIFRRGVDVLMAEERKVGTIPHPEILERLVKLYDRAVESDPKKE